MNRPDTAEEAIKMFREESVFDTTNATAIPDPVNRGVWLVSNMLAHEQDETYKVRGIAYLYEGYWENEDY